MFFLFCNVVVSIDFDFIFGIASFGSLNACSLEFLKWNLFFFKLVQKYFNLGLTDNSVSNNVCGLL